MGGGTYGAANVQVPMMTGLDEFDYDNEPPLLEELGIRFDHIWSKTQAVVNPTKKLRDDIFEDADLAGPLFFCLILGSCLLLAGKVHFGYIYGFSMFGCLGMHMIVNLLHTKVTKCVGFWFILISHFSSCFLLVFPTLYPYLFISLLPHPLPTD
jgi:hypothetical protein